MDIYSFYLLGEAVLPNVFLTSEVGARKSCFIGESITEAVLAKARALPNGPYIC